MSLLFALVGQQRDPAEGEEQQSSYEMEEVSKKTTDHPYCPEAS